jgi:Ca2+-binding RTX toxin-like protein
VNALNSGQTLNDSFVVHAADGTALEVDVVINGATDWVLTSPYSNTNDPNNLDTNGSFNGSDSATIIGTAAGESVTGGPSNQTFDMQGGSDTVYARAGDDTVYGGAGFDFLAGQAGNDFLSGGADGDNLYGGSGNDVLQGDEGQDTLYGGSGFDTLNGGAGFDVVIGGYGVDQLTGGADQDVFSYNSVFDSGDIIIDFQKGVDSIDLRQIDPNASLAGDQAFAFNADGAAAYSIWLVQNGSNVEIYGDTDGFAGTAEFMITLQNVNLATSSMPANLFL